MEATLVRRLSHLVRSSVFQLLQPFRPSGPSRRQQVATPHRQRVDPGSIVHPALDAHRGVLRLWLRWNEGYEELTARMYDARHDPAQLEALADQLDGLRREAVAASRRLVE